MRWKTKDKPFSGRRDSFVSLSPPIWMFHPFWVKWNLVSCVHLQPELFHLEEKSILQLWDLLVREETLYFNQGTVSPLILKKDPSHETLKNSHLEIAIAWFIFYCLKSFVSFFYIHAQFFFIFFSLNKLVFKLGNYLGSLAKTWEHTHAHLFLLYCFSTLNFLNWSPIFPNYSSGELNN